MTNKQSHPPLALLGLTVGFINQVKPALAHSGHVHSVSPEPKSTDLEKISQPFDETSNDSTEALESQANPTKSEEVPTNSEVSAPTLSTAKLGDGFTLGFGESIFGLMIATPFLLLSLKKVRR